MLKKSVTYTDYNDNDVTEEFYFNFTKLEMIEKDLEMGGLEDTITRLTEIEDAQEVYAIFKSLILDSYGQKSDDGKRFIKTAELTKSFEDSPALSEIIMEFLEFPQLAAEFIEGTLPAKLVAQVKEQQAKTGTKTIELPTNIPKLEGEAIDVTPKPKDPKDMTKEELLEAFKTKNQA